MGNSVSAHIYETKVFRPYPVILYRLRLTPLSIGGKKLVSLGTTKLAYSVVRQTVLVYMHDQIPI